MENHMNASNVPSTSLYKPLEQLNTILPQSSRRILITLLCIATLATVGGMIADHFFKFTPLPNANGVIAIDFSIWVGEMLFITAVFLIYGALKNKKTTNPQQPQPTTISEVTSPSQEAPHMHTPKAKEEGSDHKNNQEQNVTPSPGIEQAPSTQNIQTNHTAPLPSKTELPGKKGFTFNILNRAHNDSDSDSDCDGYDSDSSLEERTERKRYRRARRLSLEEDLTYGCPSGNFCTRRKK
jgi:hypothetical protein